MNKFRKFYKDNTLINLYFLIIHDLDKNISENYQAKEDKIKTFKIYF